MLFRSQPKGYSRGKFDYQPDRTITSIAQAEDFAKNLFKQMGLDYKKYITEITRFSKDEEKSRPNRLGQHVGNGAIQLRIGKATEGILAHEIGHAIEGTLGQSSKDLFRKIAARFDPATNPQLKGDSYNELMKEQTQRYLKQASSQLQKRSP